MAPRSMKNNDHRSERNISTLFLAVLVLVSILVREEFIHFSIPSPTEDIVLKSAHSHERTRQAPLHVPLLRCLLLSLLRHLSPPALLK